MRINNTPPIAPLPLVVPTTTNLLEKGSLTLTSSASASTRVESPVGGPQVATILPSYSTNAGGKSYSASVEETGATYVASVEVPPEASASGSSIQAAENNLNARIDALV
jgi:hypothetical protein